jgi:hypothetical protein
LPPFASAWIPNLLYFIPCTGIIIYDGYKRWPHTPLLPIKRSH